MPRAAVHATARSAPAPPQQPHAARLPERLAQYESLLERVRAGAPVSTDDVAYVDLAAQVWMRPGFDTFVSLPRLRFEPLPHQLRAAAAALRRMRGRAILADEVGLGKTIEALLVLSELRLRGLAERVLVLVPAGLVGQWQEELDRKFGLPSRVVTNRADTAAAGDVLLASIATARRSPLRDTITSQPWDLVIVDEAHRSRNPHSASGALIRTLQARGLLLLTATPVENRLDDLFHLVTVVKPGQLGSLQEFRARHGAGTTGVREAALLQRRMREVMVRHRRSEVEVMLPRRLAETRVIAAPPAELDLYNDVSDRVRAQALAAGHASRLALQTLQRIAGSSPAALAASLERADWHDLAARARDIGISEKARALLAMLQRSPESGKVIVFTSFTATLDRLVEQLDAAGIDAAVYHGSLTRREKDAAIARFQHGVDVLLSSEAGGEGRNLQFCHTMINFDVPWNPMQIEQRLGRIHRIGQQHDVSLTNLVTRGTIEERMLRMLERKINLFELVVGELDMIVGRVQHEAEDIAARVFDAHVASTDGAEFERRLEALGDTLASARDEYIESRRRTDELAGGVE